MNQSVDIQSNENFSKEIFTGMSKAMKMLFMFYLQSLADKPKLEVTDEFIEMKRKMESNNTELQLNVFVGHLFVDMALNRLNKKTPSMDIESLPTPGYEKEISIFKSIIISTKDKLVELYSDNDNIPELADSTRDIVTVAYEKSPQRIHFVRELIGVMDEDDWYDLGYFFVEVSQGFRKGPILNPNSKTVNQQSRVEQFREVMSRKVNPDLAKDYETALEDDLLHLFQMYEPYMRAKKVYKFTKHLILLRWFASIVKNLESADSLPPVDDLTLKELEENHNNFRYQFEDFILDPEDKETKAMVSEYEELKEIINFSMSEFMNKFLKQPKSNQILTEEINILTEEIAKSIEPEIEVTESTPQQLSAPDYIVKSFMESLLAM
ncbi:MAG: hypothetical protein ACRCXZ_09720 [Patescibacteria group bacterium]